MAKIGQLRRGYYHADNGSDRYTQAPDAREASHLVGVYGDGGEGFHFYLRLDGRTNCNFSIRQLKDSMSGKTADY